MVYNVEVEVVLYFECERRRKRVFECECEGPSASCTSCGGDDEHGVLSVTLASLPVRLRFCFVYKLQGNRRCLPFPKETAYCSFLKVIVAARIELLKARCIALKERNLVLITH